MTCRVIPTDPVAPFWSQTTTLDGVPYLLTFEFNTRENVYYLKIESADQTTLFAQGIKLVANFPLLMTYATPPGEMLCVSTNPNNDADPGLGELGDTLRCSLLYFEQADLIAGGGEMWRNPQSILPLPLPLP